MICSAGLGGVFFTAIFFGATGFLMTVVAVVVASSAAIVIVAVSVTPPVLVAIPSTIGVVDATGAVLVAVDDEATMVEPPAPLGAGFEKFCRSEIQLLPEAATTA